MRAAMPLSGCLLLAASLSGCLGVDNMAEFKAALGFAPEPLKVLPPVARLRASPTVAAVGQVVAFSAQGSLDPQGGPLDFAWDFGDGAVARGSEATHRYGLPGAFHATLAATGLAGGAGTDAVLITVVENRAPLAAMTITREGQAAPRARAGEELAFAAAVRDPEGEPLEVRWDFGDGATALTPEARHAYARGGRYAVSLHAQDPGGLGAVAEQVLPVDQGWAGQGTVTLLQDTATQALEVGAGATGAVVRVRLPDALLGLNALAVQVRDAQGQAVGDLAVQPPPAQSGPFEASLELGPEQLAGHPPGAWSLVLQRASGAQVGYAFTAEVRY